MKALYSRGFTVVELAVIVSIMGILLSISVFGFGAWRQSVADKEVKSGIDQLRSAMDDARNFENVYPATIPEGFTNDGETAVTTTTRGSVEFRIVTAAGGGSYCARVRSTKIASVVYWINPPGITVPTTPKPAGAGCSSSTLD